ncbi:MAG: phosphatidylinositol-specific phospholipase C/glycerophosphodiester phosphodiesterase family protein [Cyclobacteriaceae bacterium]|nr:phosphatidylinositol-specific phospholipase C/glycerophosphodiester phosphodiesterase family protein [Cyclobacteriaceae bacterium]
MIIIEETEFKIRFIQKSIFISCFFLLLIPDLIAQDFILLPNGHSHNDYTRDKPLYEALSYGFTSIEVDVFLQDKRMIVTHDDKNLNEKPTIQQLYLDPLRSIINQNGGSVFKNDSTQLVLMVDLKSEKESTYYALKNIFESYPDIIEWYENDLVNWGPLKILLTGGPPVDIIEIETTRYFTVDGAISQWSEDYPASLMPRASTNYRNYFSWYGKGEMPESEEQELRKLIKKAHQAGRKVRFWGCPDKPEVWEKLMEEGADWINVDDLKGFNEYYRSWIKK